MSLVIETVNVLNKYYGFGISDEEVINGISDTYITARMQVVMKEPLVLVDGAHNPDGVKRLTDNLKLLKGDKKLVSIVAISKNKDKEEMLKDIISVSDELVVSSYSYKRSTSLKELEEIARSIKGCSEIKISHLENIEEFIKYLDKEKIYVFSGSLYFAGDVLGIFNK